MGKDLVKREQSAAKLAKRQHMQQLFLLRLLEHNGDVGSLVAKLAKGDPQKAKRWRARYRLWLKEPGFQDMIGAAAKAESIGGLLPAVVALSRRAGKGNVPAIKLLMESTGYWSPRHTMEHTGEVAVVLKGGYRPAKVADDVDTDIPDADVVEETVE